MTENISTCITAFNEAANIERCLKSVAGWTNEIVIVDSFSTDNTVEICRRHTNRVYQRKWLGYVGQKNLIKDLAQGPWILFIDADEEVSTELRDEITREFTDNGTNGVAGYEFPRLAWFLDKWITHGEWYPDIKLRLFRKESGECVGREPHDRVCVRGSVKRLKSHLFHYTYTDIQDQIETLNRFSTIAAKSMFGEGRRFHLHDLFFRPAIRFIKGYFLKRGFLDGLAGWVIARSTSHFVFLKYAKLWEYWTLDAGKKPRRA